MKALTYGLVALSALCYSAMSYIEFSLLQLISGGLKTPDLLIFGYSFAELEAWRDAIGTNGVDDYIKWFPHGLDLVFPALFGLTLGLIMHHLLSRFARYRSRSGLVKLLLPLIFVLPYVALDYWENIMLVDFLTDEKLRDESLAQLASTATVGKFAWLGMLTIILVGLWLAGLKRRKSAAI